MTPRHFGSTGAVLSPITFGAMRLAPEADGVSSVLLRALDEGITAIDTARNYGESEAIVGRTLRAWSGPRPFLSTKVKPRDIGNWRTYVPLADQFTPDSIVDSVETSLRTLGVEQIDFLQLHQWYYRWMHEPSWLEAFESLRAAGKVRFIGVSAQDHEHDALLGVIDHRMVDGVQCILNAFESRPLVSVVPMAIERGVGVIARGVFDHGGALAGAATRESLARDVKLAHASDALVTEYLARVERLRADAELAGMDLVELGIRLALTHPGVTTLAISLGTPAQVLAAVTAARRGPLEADLAERLRRDHVWVKNFYYLSTATVDGNRSR